MREWMFVCNQVVDVEGSGIRDQIRWVGEEVGIVQMMWMWFRSGLISLGEGTLQQEMTPLS